MHQYRFSQESLFGIAAIALAAAGPALAGGLDEPVCLGGRWLLNAGLGDVAHDSSGSANHGHLGSTDAADANDPSWIPGVSSSALRFDGGDYVEVADSSTLESQHISAELWARAGGSPGFGYLVSKGALGCLAASYAVYTGGGGVAFYVHNGTGGYAVSPGAGAEVWDGQWHHIAGTYDGSFVRLYVDGAEIGSGTPATIAIGYGLSPHDNLYLGAYSAGQTCTLFFQGDIDEVRIWKRALSASEIASRAQGLELRGACVLTDGSCVQACEDGGLDCKALGGTYLGNDTGCAERCPLDCGDGDGVVGIVDFLTALANWGEPGACDIDAGGSVDEADLAELVDHWGPCP